MTQFTVRGHDLLAVERFRDDTRHMIEFEVLKDDSQSHAEGCSRSHIG